jgi:hypothetical protein
MGSFPSLDIRFDRTLSEVVPREKWGEYRKWVRFYLHFCDKYGHDVADVGSLPLFLDKLKSKGQMEEQRNCAKRAVELYRKLLAANIDGRKDVSQPSSVVKETVSGFKSGADTPQSKDASHQVKFNQFREKANAGWRDVETGLKNEIMLRHYSPKTFKTYATWVRSFRGFLVNKDPSIVSGSDVNLEKAVENRIYI